MIDGLFYDTVKAYLNLRPNPCKTNRFLINYQHGKCLNQPMGKNKIGKFPQEIASFLGIPNAAKYTGHCFRRSSTTILADNGATIEELKRHGSWRSNKAAEGYVAESEGYKRRNGRILAEKIMSPENEPEPSGINAKPPQQPEVNPSNAVKLPFSICISNCTNWHINLKE